MNGGMELAAQEIEALCLRMLAEGIDGTDLVAALVLHTIQEVVCHSHRHNAASVFRAVADDIDAGWFPASGRPKLTVIEGGRK